MKVCKLVHINDGNEVELRNGGRLFVESYPNTEQIIGMYLEKGFTVKQIMPDVTPAMNREGCYTFYKGGVLVYFEKEVESIEEADDSDIREFIRNLETEYDRDHKPTYDYSDIDEDDIEELDFDVDELEDDDVLKAFLDEDSEEYEEF